jgi:16S rRNA (uracil1498-N3)-methyltransferase
MSKELHTYYWPHLSAEPLQVMTGDEAKHAIKVMRLQVGEELRVIDGNGMEAIARATLMTKKELQFTVSSMTSSPAARPSFHLAIAPTKQIDRLEWCLEKCTEIGLARFTPLLCQNSERRNLRVDRLERIAIAAMKQSGSAFLPQVDDAISIKDFLAAHEQTVPLMIAHCRPQEKVDLDKTLDNACVMIGPEGDFTEKEIDAAISLGAKAVHLGPKRLRTETAGVVACTLMNLR